jgi:hypothetical protein
MSVFAPPQGEAVVLVVLVKPLKDESEGKGQRLPRPGRTAARQAPAGPAAARDGCFRRKLPSLRFFVCF